MDNSRHFNFKKTNKSIANLITNAFSLKKYLSQKLKENHLLLFGILIIGQEFVYLKLAALEAVNGWKSVTTFWIEMTAAFVMYFLGYLIIKTRKTEKVTLFLIIISSLLFRITLIPAGLPNETTLQEKTDLLYTDVAGKETTFERFQLFDSDVWRYLWDGHVLDNEINPYVYAPNDPYLDSLTELGTDVFYQWDDIRDNVNYPHVPTIYPPLSQWFFRLSYQIAPGSVAIVKLLLILCEFVGIFFLILTLRKLYLPPYLILLYAWNPLIIKTIAGSAHMDALLVCFFGILSYGVVSKKKWIIIASWAAAILIKLSPILLLPFLFKRIKWYGITLAIALVIAGYLPFSDAGMQLFAGFSTFAGEWQFNAGPFQLVHYITALFLQTDTFTVASIITKLLTIAVIGILFFKDDASPTYFFKAATLSFGIFLLLSPTVMPWYISWILPFAVISRQNYWFIFSFLLLFAFHIMVYQVENNWVLAIEYGVFFLVILLFLRQYLVYSYENEKPSK